VQMQAIQSSLMEIFCKQVLTQQGVIHAGSNNQTATSIAQQLLQLQAQQSALSNTCDAEMNG
jgi:hypothetical protein